MSKESGRNQESREDVADLRDERAIVITTDWAGQGNALPLRVHAFSNDERTVPQWLFSNLWGDGFHLWLEWLLAWRKPMDLTPHFLLLIFGFFFLHFFR
jgi:hypothetical protein